MNIHLCTNVIKKYFLLIIPNTKSRYSSNTNNYGFHDTSRSCFYLLTKLYRLKLSSSHILLLCGVVVRALGLRSIGRWFKSRPPLRAFGCKSGQFVHTHVRPSPPKL